LVFFFNCRKRISLFAGAMGERLIMIIVFVGGVFEERTRKKAEMFV
jgi:hypothetical protein